VSFTTLSCEPDQPFPPKVMGRTKTSVSLRWNAPNDNGASIQHFVLEHDEGKGLGHPLVECFKGRAKSFSVTKLQSATFYRFRLTAVSSTKMFVGLAYSAYSVDTDSVNLEGRDALKHRGDRACLQLRFNELATHVIRLYPIPYTLLYELCAHKQSNALLGRHSVPIELLQRVCGWVLNTWDNLLPSVTTATTTLK
jgi:hypothetical protein